MPEELVNGEQAGQEISQMKEAYKKYFEIAWPAAMQGLLIDLMMAIDLAMVGRLGAEALAAVGIMSQPKMVLLVFARALSVPVTAMVARRKGELRFSDMNRVLKQGLLINTLFYLPVLMVALFLLPQIVEFAGAKENVILAGSLYGRYIVMGLFFATFTQIVGAALIGTGNTKIVFKANVIGNVLNTVLNVFLIYGIGIFPRLEVQGAGIATMCGNILTSFIILLFVLNSKNELNLKGAEPWSFDRSSLSGFLKVGGSSLGEQVFERFGMFTYTKMVASLGTVQLATHHVCMNLCDIFYSFSMGLGYASASHTGQWLGGNRSDMAKAYGKIGIKIGIAVAAVFCVLYIVGRQLLMDVYTNDPRVIELGSKIVVIMAIATFPQIAQLVYSGVLKGAGDNFYVMLYSLIVIAVFRPILTYILCFKLGLGLYGAWVALIIDQTLRMVFAGLRFRSGKWMSVKV